MERLQAEVTDLTQRRSNVLAQMEELTPSGDDDVDRDLRDQLRRRYSDLARDAKAKSQQLDTLLAAAPEADNDDPSVLEQLPVVTGADLADLPEALLRALYESFQLQVRYHHDKHAVTLRVTVRDDRIPAMRDAIEQATNPPPPEHGNPGDAGCSHVLSTPNGIRTRVATLRGWCPRPLDDGGQSSGKA